MARPVDGVGLSGYSNADLTGRVGGVLEAVEDNTIADQMMESGGLVGLAAAGKEAIAVLQGKSQPSEAAVGTVKGVVRAAAATGITAYLFS